jgi:hypothetical protein
VNVHGNFKGGSFGVDLSAVQPVSQQLIAMFAGTNATAAANLFGILSGVGLIGATAGKGLIGLIRWLRGRKPSSIRLESDRAIFEINVNEATETYEVDLVAGRLYRSRTVRQALARVVRPLERDGIDTFACGAEGDVQTVVSKEELPFFEAAATEADVVSDTVAEGVLLLIEHAVFKESHKWKLNDGATTFFAEITDQDFMRRVESGQERFGKGDVLVVDLRRVQSVGDGGLKVENEVVRVREHRAPLQAPLL